MSMHRLHRYIMMYICISQLTTSNYIIYTYLYPINRFVQEFVMPNKNWQRSWEKRCWKPVPQKEYTMFRPCFFGWFPSILSLGVCIFTLRLNPCAQTAWREMRDLSQQQQRLATCVTTKKTIIATTVKHQKDRTVCPGWLVYPLVN